MKTLVLTCNTGEGHNACAKALQEAWAAAGEPCEVADALTFLSKELSAVISRAHVQMYRHLPALNGKGYDRAEKSPGMLRRHTPVWAVLAKGRKKLLQTIEEGGYDTVICTHVFPAVMLTALLEKMPLPVRTAFLATDYTCSPMVRDTRLDRYFIPDASLLPEFLSDHITPERAVATGIPVRAGFLEKMPREEAKERFGVAPDHRHLVISCGSMGCGPIEKITRLTAGYMPEDCEISVVCGTNRRLERRMRRRNRKNERVHVYGFVQEMSVLMDSADLYLTKPGGISVSEALVKNLPMLFVDAVAGCEEYNLRFFTERKAALTADSPEHIAALALVLLQNEARLDSVRRGMDAVPKHRAAEEILAELRRVPLPPKKS